MWGPRERCMDRRRKRRRDNVGNVSPTSSFISDLEMQLVWTSTHRYRTQLTAVGIWWLSVFFACTLASPIFPHVEDLRWAALKAAFGMFPLVAILAMLEMVKPSDKAGLKSALALAENLISGMKLLVVYIFLSTGLVWGSTFLRGWAMAVIPASRGKQMNSYKEYYVYSTLHLGIGFQGCSSPSPGTVRKNA